MKPVKKSIRWSCRLLSLAVGDGDLAHAQVVVPAELDVLESAETGRGLVLTADAQRSYPTDGMASLDEAVFGNFVLQCVRCLKARW